MCVRGSCFGIEVLRKPENQNVTQKIEDGFFNRGVAAFGCGDGAFDHLSIFLVHRPARREIGSINRKTGDRFPHGAGQRFEGEIAIPAVLLGQPIDHVAENIDIVGQRQFHHLQLLRVDEMTEMQRVTDGMMECLCDRRLS